MVKHIYLLIGLPGTGKTTFRKQDRFKDYTVLSSDDYIEKEATENGTTYDAIFKETIKSATAEFNRQLDYHLVNGTVPLMIDRTNLTKNSRSRFIQLARQYRYEIYGVDLNAIAVDDPGEWKRRLASRAGKQIPGYVLKNMLETYEPPTMDEGFTYIISLKEWNKGAACCPAI